jgi:hypothetical protein
MSTRNLPGGKGWSADNFTTICEPIVSQPSELPWSVTGIALPFFNRTFENVAQFKSKPDSGENYEKIELWKCLLPFSPEPFVFSSAI